MKIITPLIISVILASCSGKHDIGRLKVEGMNNLYIKLRSVDEFEPIDPIYYEIQDREGQTIVREQYFSGSEHAETNINNFTAKSTGEILYITYLDEKMVYVIYNTQTNEGYPAPTDGNWEYVSSVRNKLVKRLKQKKPDLKFDWER